jgi:hypothetical protein
MCIRVIFPEGDGRRAVAISSTCICLFNIIEYIHTYMYCMYTYIHTICLAVCMVFIYMCAAVLCKTSDISLSRVTNIRSCLSQSSVLYVCMYVCMYEFGNIFH